MTKKIYIVVTLDCERPNTETHADASGPPDYRTADAWTRAYTGIAGEYGWPVTYFIHPEVALEQTRLFLDLEAEGHCLGLHLHPWRFDPVRFPAECGGLDRDHLIAALAEAAALWQHGFGKRPLYFRPGAMSANDDLYPVLGELGFRGTGASMPGRAYPQTHSNWWNAAPDPHRAHAINRHIVGDMDLAEMPSSVDFSSVIHKNGCWYHWDLRPDFPEADYETITDNIVRQVLERDPLVPCINQVTHNDNDYTDPENRHCRHYRRTLDGIVAACRKYGAEPVGATMADIADMVLAAPPATAELEQASGKLIYRAGTSREIEL